jgi:hypothetical protein
LILVDDLNILCICIFDTYSYLRYFKFTILRYFYIIQAA